jgi:universal stress protein A
MNFAELEVILVPTDFSEVSTKALRTAVELAQKFGASIELFHVDVDPSVMLPPPADVVMMPTSFAGILAATGERLESEAAGVRLEGVTCTTASELGRTPAAIAEQARRIGAGLIVMGSHGRHGFAHAMLGSVAEKVVQHAPCAVLVIPAAP